MDSLNPQSIQSIPGNNQEDCLVRIIELAEAVPPVADHKMIADALDSHVIMSASDGDIELQCKQCPVMCTVKGIGGHAIALLHNRQACIC